MLLVTPSRTMRIRCTEVSSEFSDLPLEDQDTKVKKKNDDYLENNCHFQF